MKSHRTLRYLLGGLLGSVMGVSFGAGFSCIWKMVLTVGIPVSSIEAKHSLTLGLQVGIVFAIAGLVWGIAINLPCHWCKSIAWFYWLVAAVVILYIAFSLASIFALLLIPLAGLSLLLRWATGLLERTFHRCEKTAYLTWSIAVLAAILIGLGLAWPVFSIGFRNSSRVLLTTEQFAQEQNWQEYELTVLTIDSMTWRVMVSFSNGDTLICTGSSYHPAKVNGCEPQEP